MGSSGARLSERQTRQGTYGNVALLETPKRANAEDESAKLRAYHERIARASFTVADWRRRRFDAVYPDYDVEVLFGDGRPASPRTLLLKVRASYD